jgi:hypothetical protein
VQSGRRRPTCAAQILSDAVEDDLDAAVEVIDPEIQLAIHPSLRVDLPDSSPEWDQTKIGQARVRR